MLVIGSSPNVAFKYSRVFNRVKWSIGYDVPTFGSAAHFQVKPQKSKRRGKLTVPPG